MKPQWPPLTTDVNGDGAFGVGDVVLVREVTPLAAFSDDGDEYWVSLNTAANKLLAQGTWDTLPR